MVYCYLANFFGVDIWEGQKAISPTSQHTDSKLNVACLLFVDSKVPLKLTAAALTDFVEVIFRSQLWLFITTGHKFLFVYYYF